MRTGGYTIQQTLTTEAASVLKHSLTLARRRGHAQVTPLHVAATLLSSRASLLRRACIKSHPGFSTNYQFTPSRLHHHLHNQNHPLQCRALELCFNVALNRLPTVPGPMFHGQPSLANALVAALKRAQAHQRRGCIEQQQQQNQTQPQTQQTQLLAVKVELEQLVISILDDPSVSRVMREAGFNSTAVKNCVEDCSVSSVFYGGSVVGVFSSPNSPDQQQYHNNINRFHHYQNPKDFNFINPNFPLWQTHFLNQSPDQNPLLISSSSSHHHHHHQQRLREIDLKLVVDVLLRKKTKKKNPVIVGDSVSFTEGFVSELMAKLERGEIDQTGDLKQTNFVKFQFSPMASKFMRKEDVETNIKELRKKVVSLTTSGKNVIIFTGDLKWTVKEITNNNNGGIVEISSSYSPLDHLVEEMGKLIAEYNDELDDDDCKIRRVWVMGTASFQTYMRCQMRQPSLETLWALHPVSVPSSANLGLSLHATSGQEARNMSCVNATKSFSGYSKAEEEEIISSVLSCCPECVTSFEREAKALKANQEKLLPSWLQSHDADNSSQKEELIGLRRKWNKFCENLHSQTGQLTKNYSYGLPYGSSNESSKSISLIDSLGLKPNQRATNSIAKFRRQNSCTIEFDLGGNEYEKGESINEAEDDKGNEKITLNLGRSLFRSDSVTDTGKKISALVKALEESIPSQTVTMHLIAESVMDCVSKKKDGWIMIEGRDTTSKRRLARIVSESVFGSFECLVHIDLKKIGNESKASSETLLACGLENHEKVVFLIEDIDLADSRFLKLLADRFEEKRRIKAGIDHRQAIFILTKEDSSNARNRDSVLQIGLEITSQSPGKKRKPESELLVREGKKSKAGEIENRFWIKKEVCSRQSSFNSSYLDLNIKAEEEEEEEEEGEISPISSDLTGEEETEFSSSSFLNRIQNQFVLNRSCEPGIEKAMITAAFREVFPEGEERGGVRFSVEEKLVEELCGCGDGYIQNGAFESWLKEVFQTGLLTVKKSGKKDTGVIRMVFGQNITFGFTLFLYEAYTSFSATPAYNDWYLSLYSVLFTSLPVICLGIFDQDVSALFCLKFPVLYQEGVQNLLFSWRRILSWMFHGFCSAIIIFFLCKTSLESQAFNHEGKTAGRDILGGTMYTCVVWVVSLQMVLTISYFTLIQHLVIWGSVVIWYLFLMVYGSLPIRVSTDAYMVFLEALAPAPSYWITTLFVVLSTMMPYFIFCAIQMRFFPMSHGTIQLLRYEDQCSNSGNFEMGRQISVRPTLVMRSHQPES